MATDIQGSKELGLEVGQTTTYDGVEWLVGRILDREKVWTVRLDRKFHPARIIHVPKDITRLPKKKVNLKTPKFEGKPWKVRAVQITEENLKEIFDWTDADEMTFAQIKGRTNTSAIIYIPGGWCLRLEIGDYIVRSKSKKSEIETGSQPYSWAAYPKAKFEEEFRKGWS